MQFLNRNHLRFASLALFVAACAFVVSACDSTTTVEGDQTNNEPRETNYDVTGNVTGKVLDKATQDAISGVPVSIDALTAEGEETLTDTTDASGEFAFANVPAQSAETSPEDASGDYVVHVDGDADVVDGDYDDVRAEATLSFSSDQDSGADANNLGASVTVPLTQTNASISATATTDFGVGSSSDGIGEIRPVNNVGVTLVRKGNAVLDADGEETTLTAEDIDVGTTTTDGNGNFSFSGLPGGLDADEYYLEWQFPNQTVVTDNGDVALKNIPDSGTDTANVALELDVTDEVGANLPFQLVSAPEDGFDYETRTPEFTFTFNRAVDGALVGGDVLDEDALEDILSFDGGTRKALETDGTVKPDVTISGNTVTVTPSEPLKDGHEYTLSGLPDDPSVFFGSRFGQFAEVQAGVDYPVDGSGNHNFSIGVSEDTPDPTFRIETINPPASADTLDYSDGSVSLQVVVSNENDVPLITQEDPVEIWADNGDGFALVGTNTLGDPGDFADTDSFTVTIDEPFTSENNFNDPERYKPLEVYATLTSLNGETGQSDTKELNDRKTPQVTAARYIDEDVEGGDPGGSGSNDEQNDRNVERLEVDFNEPMAEGSFNTSDFNVTDNNNVSINSVAEVDNQDGGSTVVLELDELDQSNVSSDNLTVEGGTDLAGNGLNQDENEVTISTP